MKLITDEIAKQAQIQYKKGSSFDQMVVAKFFDPFGSWSWYLMNQDPEDPDYLWGIVKGFEVEMGSFSLSELESVTMFGHPRIERDLYFAPVPARNLWEKLQKGEPA